MENLSQGKSLSKSYHFDNLKKYLLYLNSERRDFIMQKLQKVRELTHRRVVAVSDSRKSEIVRSTMVDFIENAIEKATESVKVQTENPFNLLPSNISNIRKLERTCSTSSGTVLIQALAGSLAESYLGYGRTNYTIIGRVSVERMRRIDNILNSLESTAAKPNFKEELAYILDGKSKKSVQVIVNADLYAVNRAGNHSRIAAECKSPLANNDQAKAAKERILKLYAMEKPLIDEAYFVLNYNPYGGGRENFRWSPPMRWFDIKNGDPSVLIGEEFWDKIGGPGTYELIKKISSEISESYADEINTKFLYTSENKLVVRNPEGLFLDIQKLQDYFDF